MSDTTISPAEVAYPVYRRFKQWVSYWSLWLAAAETLGTKNERARAVEKAARKLKAWSVGYKPHDEVFYSRTTIETLLPYALQADAIPPPTVADEQEINRVHAGKEGYGGWEAAVADVRAGLAHLSRYQRNLLVLRYVEGCSVPWLARKMGVTDSTLYSAIGRAIRRIQNVLGGRKP